MTATKPICLWSGPRNVSTALMYSFAQLSTVRVVDEPLYGHYLRVSGAPHPGREAVMHAMNCDGNAVMRGLLAEQQAAPERTLFMKHMAHHLRDLDREFLQATRNVLLVRDPREMLPSLIIQVPNAGLADTGLKQQWQLLQSLQQQGQDPAVLDSRELLSNPAHVLKALCEHLELQFDPDMLRWTPGPRPEDGVWAPHWYHAVHRSSGFAPYKAKTDFPAALEGLLDECTPWYERLFEHALRAATTGD